MRRDPAPGRTDDSSLADSPIRVLVIEAQAVVADGLTLTFAHEPDLAVVGVARDGAEGERLALKLVPDVVLVGSRLADGSGVEVVRRLRAARLPAAGIVLGANARDGAALAALEAGASSYVAMTQPVAEIVEAVRRAAGSERALPASVTPLPIQRPPRRDASVRSR